MDWSFEPVTVADGITSYRLLDENARAPTMRDALELVRDDTAFRRLLAGTLASVPVESFFWECPPTSREHQDRPFEFVVVEATVLTEIEPDPSSFRPHFDLAPDADVVTFPNLAGDATLVVPAPRTAAPAYGHLATFVRTAPPGQVDELFRAVGCAIEDCLSDEPLWVSTAGLGVPWLHIRLDSRPKYYRYTPFKQ